MIVAHIHPKCDWCISLTGIERRRSTDNARRVAMQACVHIPIPLVPRDNPATFVNLLACRLFLDSIYLITRRSNNNSATPVIHVVEDIVRNSVHGMTISPGVTRNSYGSSQLFRWQWLSHSASSADRKDPFLDSSSSLRPNDDGEIFKSVINVNDDNVAPHSSLIDRCVGFFFGTLGLSALPLGWLYATVALGTVTALIASAMIFPTTEIPHVKVAMIGNSMMYYNDFPRFMGTLVSA